MATIVVTSSDNAVADIIRGQLSHWLPSDVVTTGPSETDSQDWSEAHIPHARGLVVVLRPTWNKELPKINVSITQEIEVAFRANIPVIPVLLNDAEMPRAEECPPGLGHFAYLNRFRIKTGDSFGADIERLILALFEIVGGLHSPGPKMRTPSPVLVPPVLEDDNGDASDELEAEDGSTSYHAPLVPTAPEDNDQSDTQQKDEFYFLEEFLKTSTRSASQSS
jgi:hypothetical protein